MNLLTLLHDSLDEQAFCVNEQVYIYTGRVRQTCWVQNIPAEVSLLVPKSQLRRKDIVQETRTDGRKILLMILGGHIFTRHSSECSSTEQSVLQVPWPAGWEGSKPDLRSPKSNVSKTSHLQPRISSTGERYRVAEAGTTGSHKYLCHHPLRQGVVHYQGE